ncbi:MAG: hypothetical protein PUF28_00300 [bacterium]|nr:hypothetical protein [bacterium]
MIRSVLTEPGLADSLIRQGAEQVRRFAPEGLTRQLLQCYRQLLRG